MRLDEGGKKWLKEQIRGIRRRDVRAASVEMRRDGKSSAEKMSLKSIATAIGFGSQLNLCQDTVISPYNRTKFTNLSDGNTHNSKRLQIKTTHIPGEKHAMHTPFRVSYRLQQLTHKRTHTHTLRVC